MLEKRPATHAVHDVAPERQSQLLIIRIQLSLQQSIRTRCIGELSRVARGAGAGSCDAGSDAHNISILTEQEELGS